MIRKNINRGYMKLRVWEDAIEYYRLTCNFFSNFPFECKKISSQAIASSDSIHRNIAEGYCRKSIKEYLYFLNISLGSLGESVSGIHAYRTAKQITEDEFESLDKLAFKIENGMINLIRSLENKKACKDWTDSFMVKESNEIYGAMDE